MRAALSIGEFSQITHLSVKTLRRYHDAGLLEPTEVDPHSGYRYYTTAQVPTAQVIRRFRELGMPVREVGEVLATTDPEARSVLIAGHLERLENQLDQTRAAVSSLRRLLAPVVAPIEVEECLMRHESVALAAVIGVEEDGLMKTKAFIIVRDGHTGNEALSGDLQNFVKANLSKHKYPRVIEFVTDVPKNDRGKVDRKVLRQREAAKAG